MNTTKLKDGSVKLPGGWVLSDQVFALNRNRLEGTPESTSLAKRVAKEKRKESQNRLTNLFVSLWLEFGPGIELHQEYAFNPDRRWRFDFAHLPSKVAIELEGGTNSRRTKSRHTTPEGFKGDREKYNSATEFGWSVISLTLDMITSDHVQRIIGLIKRRLG
jgi:very-short-patch-repair endonuclease